jgi:N-acetylornithine carbamoyltransferase
MHCLPVRRNVIVTDEVIDGPRSVVIDEAFDDAEVVYAKSWGSFQHYCDANQDIRERAIYRDKWIVDEAKMARTKDAIFMHCLPVRRNVIVSDAVIDSANSVVIDEAENRLHVQKAIMTKLIK